ncbi:hypothetical protein BS17DRAFT_795536 [Gyrodon lividus]|nr:hypothetical protein BS17DRAFT_795536 [Gyrodon lividus]
MATAEWFKQMEDMITLLQEQIMQLNMQLAATSTMERKFSKRFKVVADPGHYEGDRAKFTKWWTKIKVWMNANWDGLETTETWLGLLAGRYMEMCMNKCLDVRVWPNWDDQQVETEGVNEYTTKFLSLFRMAGMSDEHRVFLLERNSNPKIIKQM